MQLHMYVVVLCMYVCDSPKLLHPRHAPLTEIVVACCYTPATALSPLSLSLSLSESTCLPTCLRACLPSCLSISLSLSLSHSPFLYLFDCSSHRLISHCVSPAGAGLFNFLNSFVDRTPLEPRLLLGWLPPLRGFTGWLFWSSNFGWWSPENNPHAHQLGGGDSMPLLMQLDHRGRSNFNVTVVDNGVDAWARTNNGDGLLVYPGPTSTPFISSLRLEAMRSGVEDGALLRRYAACVGQESMLAQVRKLVRRGNDVTRDSALLEATRREVGEAVHVCNSDIYSRRVAGFT